MNREKLKEVLFKNVPDVSNKQVWIWGAGNTARLYQEGLRRLEGKMLEISGYIDKDIKKGGKEGFNGKPLICPKELIGMENICILVCSIVPETIHEIGELCSQLSLEWYIMDEVILKLYSAEVLECYDILEDQASKDAFAEVVICRIEGKKPSSNIMPHDIYFALDPFAKENADEIFVDCGAYIGDTIEEYLRRRNGAVKNIIAFEPDPVNFEILKKKVKEECSKWEISEDIFHVYPFGVGNECKMGFMRRNEDNDGLGSAFLDSTQNGENSQIVSLDEVVTDGYSFIKADIESYEYQMLEGAKKGIRKYKPKLAICIYHSAVDLFSIALLIKKILPEYRIFIRQHATVQDNTILYAYI